MAVAAHHMQVRVLLSQANEKDSRIALLLTEAQDRSERERRLVERVAALQVCIVLLACACSNTFCVLHAPHTRLITIILVPSALFTPGYAFVLIARPMLFRRATSILLHSDRLLHVET